MTVDVINAASETRAARRCLPWAADVVVVRTWRREYSNLFFFKSCDVAEVVLMYSHRGAHVVRAECMADALAEAQEQYVKTLLEDGEKSNAGLDALIADLARGV